MTTKQRIIKLEQEQKPHGVPRLFVYFEGNDFGTCNGAEMSLAEWDKKRMENDKEICIRFIAELPKDSE
jgi:hypothetical protein